MLRCLANVQDKPTFHHVMLPNDTLPRDLQPSFNRLQTSGGHICDWCIHVSTCRVRCWTWDADVLCPYWLSVQTSPQMLRSYKVNVYKDPRGAMTRTSWLEPSAMALPYTEIVNRGLAVDALVVPTGANTAATPLNSSHNPQPPYQIVGQRQRIHR